MNLPQEFRNSSRKAIWVLLASIGFVLLGIFILRIGQNNVLGWTSILFFGLGIPVSLRNLSDRSTVLRIDDDGVYHGTTKTVFFPWTNIASVDLFRIGRLEMVRLKLHSMEADDPGPSSPRKLTEALGSPNIYLIPVTHIDISAKNLLLLLQQRLNSRTVADRQVG